MLYMVVQPPRKHPSFLFAVRFLEGSFPFIFHLLLHAPGTHVVSAYYTDVRGGGRRGCGLAHCSWWTKL